VRARETLGFRPHRTTVVVSRALTADFLGYWAFCEALLFFFSEDLDEQRLKTAECPESGPRSLSALALARESFAIDPQLARERIQRFTDSWREHAEPELNT
jgi:hypothetical protein